MEWQGILPIEIPLSLTIELWKKKKIKTHIIFTIVIDNVVVVIRRLKMHFYTLKY